MGTPPTTGPRTGQVPSAWLGLFNTWNAADLLELLRKVTARGIDPGDHAAVRAVWNEPKPMVTVARYAVSIIGEDDSQARHFTVAVERYHGRWLISHDGLHLDPDGREWVHVSNAGRWDDLDQALALARDWAPRVGTGRYTAVQWLAHRADQAGAGS